MRRVYVGKSQSSRLVQGLQVNIAQDRRTARIKEKEGKRGGCER